MGLFKKKPQIKAEIDYSRGGVNVDLKGEYHEFVEMGLQVIDTIIDVIQENCYRESPEAAKALRIEMMNDLFKIYEQHGLKLIDLRGKEDE